MDGTALHCALYSCESTATLRPPVVLSLASTSPPHSTPPPLLLAVHCCGIAGRLNAPLPPSPLCLSPPVSSFLSPSISAVRVLV